MTISYFEISAFLILIIYFRLTHIFVDIEEMQILHVESSYLNSSNMLHNQVHMLALYRIVSKLEYVISFDEIKIM